MKKFIKCPASGTSMMLCWPPDKKTDYPGAVVCDCSFGVLVRKGSAHPATSLTGFEGTAGVVRNHYVKERTSRDLDDVEMRYTK